jgi:hypothetical protein
MKTTRCICIFGLFATSILIACGCRSQANTKEQSSSVEKKTRHAASAVPPDEPLKEGPFLTQISYVSDSSNAEPVYQSLPLSQWIQTHTAINPKRLTLAELLTLKMVSFDEEWGTARFELPIWYDAATTNVFGGGVDLGWFNNDGDFIPCSFGGCERATNGNCVLWWDINWNSPGKHDLRARLIYYNNLDPITVVGQPMVFYSSNVCQFLEGATFFNSEGTQLYAKLRSARADFRVELTTLEGKHVKTVTGSTTDGCITNEWNLLDDHGKKFEGDAFTAAFYVTYPDDKQSHGPTKVTFTRVADPIANEPKN